MNEHSQNLHHFVAQSIEPSLLIQSGLQNADLHKAILFLKDQSCQLRINIGFELLKAGTDKYRKKWLSALQQQLVFQSDMVCRYLVHDQKVWNSHVNAAEIRSLYIHALDAVEDLISFCQDKFSAHADWTVKYSDSMLKNIIPELRLKVSDLKKLLEVKGIDADLIGIVSSGLSWLLRSPNFSPVNRAYLLKMYNAVYGIAGLTNDTLMAVLIACDFNDPELYHYRMLQIEYSLDDIESLYNQRERILKEKHLTAKIKPLDAVRLYQKQPSLRQEMVTAITEKEVYLEKLMELIRQEMHDEQAASDAFRICTEMPGPQVAIFLRMMLESGTWMRCKITDLAKFFCRNFVDTQGASFTPDNLVKRSSEIQFSSALKLWEVTEVWRNWLDDKYNIRAYQRTLS